MDVFVLKMSLLIIVGGLGIRVVRKSPPFFHEILVALLHCSFKFFITKGKSVCLHLKVLNAHLFSMP